MAMKILKLASTNIIEIADVYDEVGLAYLTSANATATAGSLLDANKAALVSPVALTWVYVTGTSGTWRATIADTVALVDVTNYYASVKLTITATGVVRTVYVPCRCRADDS